MGYRDYKDEPCVICGKIFPSRCGAKYCSTECKKEGDRRNAKVSAQRRKEEKNRPKIKSQTLAEIAKKAREAGMQYGDYVAKFGL